MAQESEISLELFASGYCTAHANVVNPKEGKGKSIFHALWALINIPNIGYVLFDTGYSNAFNDATSSFPGRFYRWMTPMNLIPGDSAKELLEKQNISVDEIKYIIISHFHADHVAGLKDFPNAEFICSKSAFEEATLLKGMKAVSKGILNQLLPDDIKSRTIFIEDLADKIFINNAGITEFELFGNQIFKLILLPGHAKGMLGFIFKNGSKNILYATDASWSYDTYTRGILPKKVVKLFFDSWDDYVATLQKIKTYEKHHKDCEVLFTHCIKSLDYISNEI